MLDLAPSSGCLCSAEQCLQGSACREVLNRGAEKKELFLISSLRADFV